VDFIEMTATSFLREAFQADRVGIWHVDLAGAGSYCLADAPAPPEAFHDYALRHPLVRRFRDTGSLAPLRDSDLSSGTTGDDTGPGTLAIPLAVGEEHVRVVSITRVSPAFSTREVLLAGHLQPVLAGIWPVRRSSPAGDGPVRAGCEGLPWPLRPAPAAYPRPGRGRGRRRVIPSSSWPVPRCQAMPVHLRPGAQPVRVDEDLAAQRPLGLIGGELARAGGRRA
jgi:hypothetical protein